MQQTSENYSPAPGPVAEAPRTPSVERKDAKPSQVTVAELEAACVHLWESGEFSLRKIRDAVGGRGSMSTISRVVRQWREAKEAQRVAPNALPERLRVAMAQELDLERQQLRKEARQEVADQLEHLEFLDGALEQAEQEAGRLRESLTIVRRDEQQMRTKVRELQMHLDQSRKDSQHEREQLEARCENLQTRLEAASKDFATAEARAAQAVERADLATDEKIRLERARSEHHEMLADAQKTAAVAKEHARLADRGRDELRAALKEQSGLLADQIAKLSALQERNAKLEGSLQLQQHKLEHAQGELNRATRMTKRHKKRLRHHLDAAGKNTSPRPMHAEKPKGA